MLRTIGASLFLGAGALLAGVGFVEASFRG